MDERKNCGLLAIHRLKENRDFRRVFRRGKSTASSHFVLYWYWNREPQFRVGFSVSKKVGNAVERNRLKRILRECFHDLSKQYKFPSIDIVIVCRVRAKGQSYQVLYADLVKVLRRAKFMV